MPEQVFLATPHGSAIRPWMNEVVSNIPYDECSVPNADRFLELSEELAASTGFRRVCELFNVIQFCGEDWLGCPESYVSQISCLERTYRLTVTQVEHNACLSLAALQMPIFGNRRRHYIVPECNYQDEIKLMVGRLVSQLVGMSDAFDSMC
jgi:hypothetical protein